jgi:hypothetical protein
MDGEELASGLDCWSAAFWHPATTMPTDKADNEIVAKKRFIKSSHRLEVRILKRYAHLL